MTDSSTPSSFTHRALAKAVGIGCVAIALLFAVVWSHKYFPRSGVKTVDFEDLFAGKSSDGGTTTDLRPVLRVAVAAMISPNITKHYYEDLLRAVGDSVGRRVVFLQRKTYAEVNDLLEHKKIDVAFVCSGPYVAGHKRFGMEILAVPVVNGGKVYHSYILAQRDSPITSLDDLKGKRFAFTDPKSNTGYLVPQYMLLQRGHTPEKFFGETSYTYSHDNSIKAVAEGVADGAAVDNLIWEFINATDPTYTSRTRIVEKSPPYGIPPVVVHPELDPDLKNRLRAALLSLHKQPEAVRILKRLHIERFEEGDDTTYNSVRDMEAWLENREKTKAKAQVK
jgi:phosphonate transport system substrate-binding protein